MPGPFRVSGFRADSLFVRVGFGVAEAQGVFFVVDPQTSAGVDRDAAEFFKLFERFALFGFVAFDLPEQRSFGAELVDHSVFFAGVGLDVDVALGGVRAAAGVVDGDAFCFFELAFALAGDARLAGGGRADLVFLRAARHAVAPGGDEGAFRAELLNPVVAGVHDVDVSGGFADGDAGRLAEVAGTGAGRAKRRERPRSEGVPALGQR